jgi:hypothetical protein
MQTPQGFDAQHGGELLHTAQRRGDVIRMGWQHLRGDNIVVCQERTDTLVVIPVDAELMKAFGPDAAH